MIIRDTESTGGNQAIRRKGGTKGGTKQGTKGSRGCSRRKRYGGW